MPRRTALDTLFDNENVPTADELATMAEAETQDSFELDPEDFNQAREGLAGDINPDAQEGDDEEFDEDYQAAISGAIAAAEDYIDMELSPDREMAARYYRGEPFGNEIENRSAVVMTEVRDTVLAIMPPLLRIFCGSKDAVEFISNPGTPSMQAKMQTAYINQIIQRDNAGFMIFHNAFKDALVRKTGVLTWWHEEKETVTEEIMTGLNEDAYAQIIIEKKEASSEDENLKYVIEVLAERPDTTVPEDAPDLLNDGMAETPEEADLLQQVDPSIIPQEPPQNFIRDIRVRKVTIQKRHRVAAVPPEEFICTPVASDNIDEFPLVGRRQMKTIGDLIALGHSEEKIREAVGGNGGANSQLNYNTERTDRDPSLVERLFDTNFQNVDDSSEYVKYCVVYVLIDKDGDGILERRKICTVGDNNVIIFDSVVDEMVPFALLCPDPEPHSPFGYSLADQTMDMQEIKSEMVRGILDSLAESIVGRTAIVEGKVNIDDALSNDRDQVIRTKEVGAIWSLSRPFAGANAIPVLDYIDNVKARRTGVTMAPAGLSPDTLQSTSTDAANAVVDASQERAEMIARIFAETGIKRLMRGLLKNVVRHQDQKRVMRLFGQPVTVDPREFNADLDLETNVGLGRGTAGKRLFALQLVLGQQKEIYKEYGPTNPLVGLHHISNTVEDMMREVEINDVSRYMNLFTEADNKAYVETVKNQPHQPTPEELLYKAQSEKTNAEANSKAQAEETKRLKIVSDEKLKTEQMDQQFYLRAAELLGKFGIQVSEQEMRAAMAHDEAADKMADDAMTRADGTMQQLTGPVQAMEAQ